MKARLPLPQHSSYLRHRRQAVGQILVPVVIAALLVIAFAVMIGLATFRGDGDVGRWSAISTIWILIPIMVAGVIFLALLGGLIYLMARLLGILPSYTILGQDFTYRLTDRIMRASETSVKPVFVIDHIWTTIKAILGRR